jgi:tetratricopeptide (TPR) repeat protein
VCVIIVCALEAKDDLIGKSNIKQTLSAIEQQADYYITRAHMLKKMGRLDEAVRYYSFLGKLYKILGQDDLSHDFFVEKSKVLEQMKKNPVMG